MTVLERLKLELANREYLTDTEYIVFLKENELDEKVIYVKPPCSNNYFLQY
jgi:hypothetical protein